MRERWRELAIGGVLRRTMPAHDDERGSFRELWRTSWTAPIGSPPFVQANLSRSKTGVLRGLHFHLRQVDLWVLLAGRAHVALVDVRPGLSGEPDRVAALSDVLGPGDAVLIPTGVAHGFWALERVDLLYLVSNEYDGTDEHGFAWNDPAAGAEWPPGEPILSGRDRSAPSLAEAVRRIRQAPQMESR